MRRSRALRVTLTYALAAAAWIVASDLFVAWAPGEFDDVWQDIAKGLVFVGVTAAILFAILTRDERRARAVDTALAASERRLREAQRVARVGNWETDLATGSMVWSDEIWSILEIDPATPPSMEAVVARIHPDDREALTSAYARRLRDYSPIELIGRLRMDDGRIKWARTKLETERDDGGRPVRGYGTLQDITDLKAAEEARAKGEDRYRKLFVSNPHPMFVYDRDSLGILAVNDAALRQYGYSRDEFLAMTIRDIRPAEDVPWLLDHLARRMDGLGQPTLARHLRKDGTVIDVEVTSHADEFDGARGVLALALDVTERLHAEKQVREALERSERAMLGTIDAALRMVELRDPYTAGHQRRVGELAAAIGAEMGMTPEKCQALRLSGYLHDVGKIGVPSEILAKPGKLLAAEFGMIELHAQMGFDILKDCELAWPVAEVARQHHERMDGSGYPRGLRGDEIIVEARIVAIADVVESMSSPRPYRENPGLDAALAEIEGAAGRLYDREAAAACVRLFGKGFAMPRPHAPNPVVRSPSSAAPPDVGLDRRPHEGS
ncbi:Cyclic di-GMP phosphodiesterase [Burkholderiales bacterium]|nr:Cyclic di-GMP phosphodiesterase [Burkholderiales bacterium]